MCQRNEAAHTLRMLRQLHALIGRRLRPWETLVLAARVDLDRPELYAVYRDMATRFAVA